MDGVGFLTLPYGRNGLPVDDVRVVRSHSAALVAAMETFQDDENVGYVVVRKGHLKDGNQYLLEPIIDIDLIARSEWFDDEEE